MHGQGRRVVERRAGRAQGGVGVEASGPVVGIDAGGPPVLRGRHQPRLQLLRAETGVLVEHEEGDAGRERRARALVPVPTQVPDVDPAARR